jgi:flagellar basal-body rod modification protein FlgD
VSTQAVNTNTSSSLLGVNTGGNTPLDKGAFLKLLLTQLTNQDPLKPTDDTQFISQLAQFSSLEQMQNMNTNLSNYIDTQSFTQATGLIGKAVQWTDADTGTKKVGQVESVMSEDGAIHLIVPGMVQVTGSDGTVTSQMQDQDIPIASVQNVFDAENTQSTSAALGWIGKTVTGTEVVDGKEVAVTGTVSSVGFQNGLTVLSVKSGDNTYQMPLAYVTGVTGS